MILYKGMEASGLRPKNPLTNSTAVQHMGEKNDVELFATVLRSCFDAQNVVCFIVENRFRILTFVRL